MQAQETSYRGRRRAFGAEERKAKVMRLGGRRGVREGMGVLPRGTAGDQILKMKSPL